MSLFCEENSKGTFNIKDNSPDHCIDNNQVIFNIKDTTISFIYELTFFNVFSSWILSSGSWDDSKFWSDEEKWNDG